MFSFRPRARKIPLPAAPAIKTLFKASSGTNCKVVALTGGRSTCHRLREMGFCENAQVKKLSAGGNTICTVCGSRVALSRQLAESIVVE